MIDSSAVIALLRHERGWETVHETLLTSNSAGSPAVISAVNLSEVIGKLGSDLPSALFDDPHPLIETVDYTTVHARAVGAMFSSTRKLGLSLADRACLVLADSLDLPALTANSVWRDLKTPVEVQLIH